MRARYREAQASPTAPSTFLRQPACRALNTQLLKSADGGSTFQEMRGEGVAKR